MSFVAASPFTKSFTCPHCGVLARQHKWGYPLDNPSYSDCVPEAHIHQAALKISKCENCEKNCIWVGDLIYVYPSRGNAPPPNPDMPDDVRKDYEEAASIYEVSPRGAAALLRLAVQKLMVFLDQPGKNINDDIKALVSVGLPIQVQQALDIVRVTGNNAVHPGKLDADDTKTAAQLFPLLNVIVEYRISLPSRINEMFEALPDGAKAGIQQRDGN